MLTDEATRRLSYYNCSRWSKTACDVTISPRKLAFKLLCIRGSRRESKRKQPLILLFKRFSFLKTQVHFRFSPRPYSGASNLGKIYANFSGEIVTSSSILDHRVRFQVLKNRCKNYIKFRLLLVCHLLRNRLLCVLKLMAVSLLSRISNIWHRNLNL